MIAKDLYGNVTKLKLWLFNYTNAESIILLLIKEEINKASLKQLYTTLNAVVIIFLKIKKQI